MPERQILFRTFGRIFTGLSDTSKAFLIILITGGWLHACLRAMVWLVRIPSGGGKATRGRPPHYAHRWVLANVCACGRVWWWWQACWARHGAACSFTMALPAPVQWCLPGYHSEEGWTATLRILSGHYGMEAEASGAEVELPWCQL